MAADPDQVRTDLDRIEPGLPPLAAEFRADPVAGLTRLAAEVLTYWNAAIAPFWPRIQHLAEGEILRRARQMPTGGPAALFADLHPRVSWERGTLRAWSPGTGPDVPCCTCGRRWRRPCSSSSGR